MITENQFKDAADELGCDIAAIKAVNKVESSGGGFLPNGDVKILFEPHVFWRELLALGISPAMVTGNNADILYPKWKSGAYGKESAQHGRLDRAMKINPTAALKSASWGAFQIMGNNYRKAGYNSVEEMVEDYKKGENNQLLSFVKYLKSTNMAQYLINHDWAKFAELYNGRGYKGSPDTIEDDYDFKLKSAYRFFS